MSNFADAAGAYEAKRKVNTPKGSESCRLGTWAYS
jgi:hypothetical protein